MNDNKLWVHRDSNPGTTRPHELMAGDVDIIYWLTTDEADAIDRQIGADLPEGVVLMPCAPGSVVRGLPDHRWQRSYGGKWQDDGNAQAIERILYPLRRVEKPAPPATRKVPLHLLPGEKLPGCDWVVEGYTGSEVCASAWLLGNPSVVCDITIDADGMVEVQA